MHIFPDVIHFLKLLGRRALHVYLVEVQYFSIIVGLFIMLYGWYMLNSRRRPHVHWYEVWMPGGDRVFEPFLSAMAAAGPSHF